MAMSGPPLKSDQGTGGETGEDRGSAGKTGAAAQVKGGDGRQLVKLKRVAKAAQTQHANCRH